MASAGLILKAYPTCENRAARDIFQNDQDWAAVATTLKGRQNSAKQEIAMSDRDMKPARFALLSASLLKFLAAKRRKTGGIRAATVECLETGRPLAGASPQNL